MNKQLKVKDGRVVSRGIEWVGTVLGAPHPGSYPWTLPDGRVVYLLDDGWTSNPIGGCHYGCQWVVPDGTVVECYANRVAGRLARAAYPDGFAPVNDSQSRRTYYWRPSELEAWMSKEKPCEIFVGSMADMFGPWVSPLSLIEVLGAMAATPRHRYFVLTKNPARAVDSGVYPDNVWVGASVPPSAMNGRELTWLRRASMLLGMLSRLQRVAASLKWLSIEPLSFDVAGVLSSWVMGHGPLRDAVQWVVIGAATNGPKAYQPKQEWVEKLLALLDAEGIPVFFKGNLVWRPEWGHWREDKPYV